MAGLNSSSRRLVASTMGGLAVLGLCSCSRDSANVTPTGGPTANIEQTIAPSPSPTASAAEAPFDVRTATEGDWSAYSDGYTFSEQPEGAGEQFIADTYPDLWAQGVRVLSNKQMAGYNLNDPALPGAVIQYINNERYEGTISTPLGFRGQTASPDTLPSDTVANRIAAINGRGAWPEGNSGQGGYTIDIMENAGNERNMRKDIVQSNDTQLVVYQFDKFDRVKQIGETMRFADWQSAWAYAQSNGYSVPGMERPLYPGEVANVTVVREVVDANNDFNGSTGWVWDPGAGDWALAIDQTFRK